MKRLCDTSEFGSESEQRLADLFCSAERYRPNPLRKRRIEIQIATRPRRRAARAWQPALLAVLLVTGTAAAAVLGHRLIHQGERDKPPLALFSHSGASVQKRTPAPMRAPASAVEEVERDPASAVSAEPAVEREAPVVVKRSRARGLARASSQATKPRSTRPIGEDPTRVAEALRALRKQGDPERAQSLLSEYMKANPHGALSEEALALSIEAAHTRHDPAAKRYARRYLARYPAGRHAALARRVLTQ